jgi:transketolase
MSSVRESRGPRSGLNELHPAAQEMRAIAVTDLFAADSGHPSGSLSNMDVATALYLNRLNHDPLGPSWPESDRVFWSARHTAPALFVPLGRSGSFSVAETGSPRQLGPKFDNPNFVFHCAECRKIALPC